MKATSIKKVYDFWLFAVVYIDMRPAMADRCIAINKPRSLSLCFRWQWKLFSFDW